jgi:hypothetical protein
VRRVPPPQYSVATASKAGVPNAAMSYAAQGAVSARTAATISLGRL